MTTSSRPSLLSRFLGAVESVGNALPHPATLFAALGAVVVVASWLLSELESPRLIRKPAR